MPELWSEPLVTRNCWVNLAFTWSWKSWIKIAFARCVTVECLLSSTAVAMVGDICNVCQNAYFLSYSWWCDLYVHLIVTNPINNWAMPGYACVCGYLRAFLSNFSSTLSCSVWRGKSNVLLLANFWFLLVANGADQFVSHALSSTYYCHINVIFYFVYTGNAQLQNQWNKSSASVIF